MEVAVTTGAISRAKLQSNHHHQQTNTQFFYRPDALPVTQPTVSKHWRENITFHGLAYPNSPGGLPTLSLTTNSSWCQHPKGLTWSNLWKKGQCIITRRTATTLCMYDTVSVWKHQSSAIIQMLQCHHLDDTDGSAFYVIKLATAKARQQRQLDSSTDCKMLLHQYQRFPT